MMNARDMQQPTVMTGLAEHFRKMFVVILLLYIALVAYAYFFSDRLMFQPHPSSYGDGKDILKVRTASGRKISAIYFPNVSARYTLLVSHGNAEDLGDDREWLQDLRRAGFSVFAFDYEGYGTSEGKPTEQALYDDEFAAYDYLALNLATPPDRILIYGRSIGGGPAIHLAARRPAAGLILQSAFVSAFRVLTRVPLLFFDKFPNSREIRHVHCPVLVMHGTADSVIAPWHGDELFRRANEPKQFFAIQGADHNDAAVGSTAAALIRFTALLDGQRPGF
jgi:alpha-beta hydrolase superfamily lysophospholipase